MTKYSKIYNWFLCIMMAQLQNVNKILTLQNPFALANCLLYYKQRGQNSFYFLYVFNYIF